jgi:quinoprotein glucose dehydrogenase
LKKTWRLSLRKNVFTSGKETAVELPGLDGCAEWGGPSYDPQTGLLYVNANEMGWLLTMRDVQSEPADRRELL